jgi:hypothetical protein
MQKPSAELKRIYKSLAAFEDKYGLALHEDIATPLEGAKDQLESAIEDLELSCL